jgi:hypothetical protein
MGLVSFELATVFLGGDNSLSQLGMWKCRGYVRILKYADECSDSSSGQKNISFSEPARNDRLVSEIKVLNPLFSFLLCKQ